MNSTPALQQLDTDVFVGPSCHEPCVRGMGSIAHGVMVIGVAPGKDELQSGRPLTGPTGQLFDQLLAAIDFPRKQVYVTNMCCWYIDGKITSKHMDECYQRIRTEIVLVRPRLIITLGTEVCQYWTGYPITKARGAALWNEEYQCYVMPMIQPAALFHSGDMDTSNTSSDKVSNAAYDIVRDLRKIPAILSWPQDGSYSHVDYSVVESTAQAQQILDSLPRDGTPVSLDVETNHKSIDVIDIRRDELICLGISTGVDTWVFPVSILQHPDRAESLVTWPTDVNWTFHNAVFDTAIVNRYLGVWLPVGEDTMLRSYACDERPGYHGLKPLAREYEGAGFWEKDREKGNLPQLYAYNAKDAAYTARLVPKLRKWSEDEGTAEMYNTLLIPAVNAFKEIQARGARVDAQLLYRLEVEWGNERDAELDRMQDIAHDAGWPNKLINLNSPMQLSKLLYQIIGLSGGPSTNKDHLEELSGQHPFVDALREFRHLERNYATYIDSFCKHIRVHGLNHGRVHSTVKLHGTATGRLSYGEPPVQTIPRPSNYENKYGMLRQAFIPTDDSYEIGYADYQRAEIWTAYGYSGDQTMFDALQKDYHLETAVTAMRIPREKMERDAAYKEEMRRIAKTVTFGIMYGREAYSLSEEIGRTVWEAQEYIDAWFANNKQYTAWYHATLRELERTGEVTSITGRKRRFVMLRPNPRVLKQAVNFPIQSTASDVTLSAIIELHPILKQYDTHILFAVHDAIVFEIKKAYRHIVIPLIAEIMQKPRFANFPGIPVDFAIGKSWGQAQKIKDMSIEALRWAA